MQIYVNRFVSDLRQVGGFLRVFIEVRVAYIFNILYCVQFLFYIYLLVFFFFVSYLSNVARISGFSIPDFPVSFLYGLLSKYGTYFVHASFLLFCIDIKY